MALNSVKQGKLNDSHGQQGWNDNLRGMVSGEP